MDRALTVSRQEDQEWRAPCGKVVTCGVGMGEELRLGWGGAGKRSWRGELVWGVAWCQVREPTHWLGDLSKSLLFPGA